MAANDVYETSHRGDLTLTDMSSAEGRRAQGIELAWPLLNRVQSLPQGLPQLLEFGPEGSYPGNAG